MKTKVEAHNQIPKRWSYKTGKSQYQFGLVDSDFLFLVVKFLAKRDSYLLLYPSRRSIGKSIIISFDFIPPASSKLPNPVLDSLLFFHSPMSFG